MTDCCIVCGTEIPEGYGTLCYHCGKKAEENQSSMTINEYQQQAMRTVNPDLTPNDSLLNGLMGLNGEAGEAIDLLKKHMFQGHALDHQHIARELGDIAWYLALSANAIGYPLEDILKMNVEKLRERYPRGFDRAKSVTRDPLDV